MNWKKRIEERADLVQLEFANLHQYFSNDSNR